MQTGALSAIIGDVSAALVVLTWLSVGVVGIILLVMGFMGGWLILHGIGRVKKRPPNIKMGLFGISFEAAASAEATASVGKTLNKIQKTVEASTLLTMNTAARVSVLETKLTGLPPTAPNQIEKGEDGTSVD